MQEVDLSKFYFVSGHEKVHTGYEVSLMIEHGHISPDAYCCITGALDLLFWFKSELFQQEGRHYLATGRLVHYHPVTAVDIVSSIASRNVKVHLLVNGQKVKTV